MWKKKESFKLTKIEERVLEKIFTYKPSEWKLDDDFLFLCKPKFTISIKREFPLLNFVGKIYIQISGNTTQTIYIEIPSNCSFYFAKAIEYYQETVGYLNSTRDRKNSEEKQELFESILMS